MSVCQEEEKAKGGAYPRSCPTCKFGPCQRGYAMSGGTLPAPNPWRPMSKPIDVKHLGKLAEELGECASAVARCLIQGIDEAEPVTGKINRVWLGEEIADVLTNVNLVIDHFDLPRLAIQSRVVRKTEHLRAWHAMLDEPKPATGAAP